MSKKIKVAVLISGNGTNLQALIDACIAPSYPAEIVLVISNTANAKGIVRAREAGITTRIIDHTNYSSREEFDTELSMTLSNSQCKLVCLAGFMRVLSESFVNTWPNSILNIHPSLLPSFPGTKTHERALEAGVKVSGCTLHFVTAELDAGPIIEQDISRVSHLNSIADFIEKGRDLERIVLLRALKLHVNRKVMVYGNKTVVFS